MAVSNLHQGVVAGAAANQGAAPFDSTLIPNSVWLDGSADNLQKTFSGSASATEGVYSIWLQRTGFGTDDGIFATYGTIDSATKELLFAFRTDNKFQIYWFQGGVGSVLDYKTNRVFRDIGWYHILFSYKTDEAVAANRAKLYINGIEETSYATKTNPTASFAPPRPFASVPFGIGLSGETGSLNSDFFHGYIAQATFLDGHSIQGGDVTVSSFLDTHTYGTNGSQFVPKKNSDIADLASAAGTNSFCIDFANGSDLDNDASTKNNDFTANSMAAANQSTNTPSLVYPFMNPLDQDTSTSTTLSDGNLKVSMGTAVGDGIRATMQCSGKVYFEVEIDSIATNSGSFIGIATSNHDLSVEAKGSGNRDAFVGINSFDSNLCGFISGSNFDSSYGGLGNNFGTAGKYLMFAIDIDAGKFWGGYDGTWFNSGNPAAGSNDSGKNLALYDKWFPAISRIGSAGSEAFIFNFGQSSFAHTPPSGFKSLNSSTLTAPDYQGIDYFDATLYEGNGTGQRVGDFVPFTDAYTVTNSVMFDDGDSRSLTLNSSATRTSATVAAFSLWTKRANLGTDQRPLTVQVDSSNYFSIYYNTSDQLDFTINNGGATILQRITTRAFKDNSAWHNIVVIINQGESTQADRVKVFYDGVQIPNDSTGFGTNTCTLDGSSALNFLDSASAVHDVGGGSSTGFTQPYDGYVAEVAFLDGADSGAKLNASDFGQVDTSTNRWVPKDIGSYNFGNTGYYLEFKVAPGTSNGAGTDTSGESNNFTSNGSWATSDQVTDAPSKNYATLSQVIGPTPSHSSGGDADMSDGNLRFTLTGGTNSNSSTQTPSEAFAIQEGKWYFEVEAVTLGQAWNHVGLVDVDDYAQIGSSSTISDAIQGQWAYSINNASTSPDAIIADGTFSYGSDSPYNGVSNHKVDTGDVLGVHIERTGNVYKMWFSRNGTHYLRNTTQQPIIEFSTRGRVVPFARATNGTGNRELHFNFGQQLVFDGSSTTFNAASDGYWKNAPASGFKAINQDNLDATASKLTAWAWIKNRDAADNHILVDRVRGVGKDIHANDSPAQVSNVNTVQRFLQRGVQIGSDVEVNTAKESYVLWQWLVGASATTGSTTSPAGSIASTSIVADAGHFSIVQYEGTKSNGTVGHGLSAAPEMIMIKDIDATESWIVGHDDIGWTKNLYLNLTNAVATSSTIWQDTAPTSSVFSIGTSDGVNKTETHIAYCFRSVPGVCKVGSYVGNGQADGTYVSLGFKPRWIMYKLTGTESWEMYDTARQVGNVYGTNLKANLPNAETDDTRLDILSDGFKARSSNSGINTSGSTYIYLAMAEIGGNGTLPPIYGI